MVVGRHRSHKPQKLNELQKSPKMGSYRLHHAFDHCLIQNQFKKHLRCIKTFPRLVSKGFLTQIFFWLRFSEMYSTQRAAQRTPCGGHRKHNQEPLPPPSNSTLFVVRNGRYEPENLMPMLPRILASRQGEIHLWILGDWVNLQGVNLFLDWLHGSLFGHLQLNRN